MAAAFVAAQAEAVALARVHRVLEREADRDRPRRRAARARRRRAGAPRGPAPPAAKKSDGRPLAAGPRVGPRRTSRTSRSLACDTARWKWRRASTRPVLGCGQCPVAGAAARPACLGAFRGTKRTRKAAERIEPLREREGDGVGVGSEQRTRSCRTTSDRCRASARSQEERVGAEHHPGSLPPTRPGIATTRKGQAGHRVERAHVDGPALAGSRGRRSHSKRASRTCSTSAHGARAATEPSPPRSAMTSSTASLVALGADPLVDDGAQPLDPLRPRRLAGERVERSGRGAPRPGGGPRRRPRGAADARGDPASLSASAASRSASAWARRPIIQRSRPETIPASRLSASQREGSGIASSPSISAKGMGAKVRAAITEDRGRPRQRKSKSSERAARPKRRGKEGWRRWGIKSRAKRSAKEGSVGPGGRGTIAHLLEGHAAGRLAEQPPRHRAHLRGLAGRGDELDRARRSPPGPAAARRGPRAGAAARPGPRLARSARAASRSTRPPRTPSPGEPAAERLGPERGRERAPQHPHGVGRGEGGHAARSRPGRAPGRRPRGPRPPRASARGRALARRGEERRGVAVRPSRRAWKPR